MFWFFGLVGLLLGIRVSFGFGHGSVFVIVFWVGGGDEFDEFVVVVVGGQVPS